METYVKKVDAYLESWLASEGYTLICSEFTEEDHNWYLRAYIDLTETERALREEKQRTERAAAKAVLLEAGASEEEADAEDAEEAEQVGIGINDCVKVSRRLSQWLDQKDFIKETYTLEVCSRGFLNPANETEEGEVEER